MDTLPRKGLIMSSKNNNENMVINPQKERKTQMQKSLSQQQTFPIKVQCRQKFLKCQFAQPPLHLKSDIRRNPLFPSHQQNLPLRQVFPFLLQVVPGHSRLLDFLKLRRLLYLYQVI